MTATVPHQSLRYLIRATGTPELTTNNLLEALLIADRAMYRAFLDAVGTLTGTDLVGTRLGRESYTVDELTGKQSYRDFTLSCGDTTPCSRVQLRTSSPRSPPRSTTWRGASSSVMARCPPYQRPTAVQRAHRGCRSRRR